MILIEKPVMMNRKIDIFLFKTFFKTLKYRFIINYII